MKLDELARKSRQAAEVRAYQTHPDVTALRIERVRGWSAGLIWAGVVLGLAFTMTNVQQFAANGTRAGSLTWISAWLLDPMVSLVLIGVLLAEQVTSRWELGTPVWARRTKWFALTATYVMNTWQPWSTLSAPGIVLHSVPPLLVFTAVEGGPAMREALTKAVARSLTVIDTATLGVAAPTPMNEAMNEPMSVLDSGNRVESDAVREPIHESAPKPARESRPRRTASRRKTTRTKGKRVLFADYLAIAREHLSADVLTVTPAWCRQVTGCSTGTSVRLAAALSAERAEPTTGDDSAETDTLEPSTNPVELEGEAA
jgi:hypothetical protein